MCICFVSGHQQKTIMKEWLEKQKSQEKNMLDAVSIQAKQIADDLIPQVRLCALENEMVSDILIKVHFEFSDDKAKILCPKRRSFLTPVFRIL
jgi:hypothetical protein